VDVIGQRFESLKSDFCLKPETNFVCPRQHCKTVDKLIGLIHSEYRYVPQSWKADYLRFCCRRKTLVRAPQLHFRHSQTGSRLSVLMTRVLMWIAVTSAASCFGSCVADCRTNARLVSSRARSFASSVL
jgi:hypothetical protein